MHQIKFSTSAFFSPFRDILSGGIKIDFSFKIDWVRAIWKSGRKLPDSKEKNENEAKIKPMPLPSSSNYVFGLGNFGLLVKLNFKGGLIS